METPWVEALGMLVRPLLVVMELLLSTNTVKDGK